MKESDEFMSSRVNKSKVHILAMTYQELAWMSGMFIDLGEETTSPNVKKLAPEEMFSLESWRIHMNFWAAELMEGKVDVVWMSYQELECMSVIFIDQGGETFPSNVKKLAWRNL